MSEFSNHENTDGSRPPVEGIPVVPASEAGERCGCGHLVDEHSYGRDACLGWVRPPDVLNARECGCTRVWPGQPPLAAPTVVAAVAAAEGHPITPAGLPLRTLTTEPGTVERDAELARWAADDAAQMAASRVAPDPVVRLAGPCVAAASTAWPGGKRCTERWPEIPRGWCAACKSAAQVVEGDGFVRVGSRVYPSGPLGEWPVEADSGSRIAEADEDRRRLLALFPDRATDGTLHHAVLMAVEEITRLRLELEPDERPLQSEALELLALTADYPQGHPLRDAASRLTARLARAEGRARAGVTVPAEDLDHTPGRPVCDGCPPDGGHNR